MTRERERASPKRLLKVGKRECVVGFIQSRHLVGTEGRWIRWSEEQEGRVAAGGGRHKDGGDGWRCFVQLQTRSFHCFSDFCKSLALVGNFRTRPLFYTEIAMSMAPSSSNQSKSSSNLGGKVRIIARIRGFSDQELASDAAHSKSMISVFKSGDGVKLSFDDQLSSRKNDYDVDHCYQQNEDTALIFSNEIKPHISRVFNGENSTFIAFGARDGGKTYTIKGSEEKLGLGMLVMDEILKTVEGGKHTITVSIFEVFQDHVYDLLDPKNPEVQVLEDAHRKIMLKGLSKVPVKSLLEFQKLYLSDNSLNKPTKKITLELPRRSHKALMINILACDEGGSSKLVGKMNFIDLAGYENSRRNTFDGTNLNESTRINKSLNALLNVIHAINANESRVPYRESKLARALQDSFGGNSHISMLFCLNPLFCPDTIHTVTLASRLKNIKPLVTCSAAKKQTNSTASISGKKHTKPPLSANKLDSTTKQQTNSRLPLSAKKTNSVLKGRNLFSGTEEANGFKEKTPSMENNLPNIVKSDIPDNDSTVVPHAKEEKCSSVTVLSNSDSAHVASDIVPSSHEEDASVKTQNNLPHVNGDNIEKENNSLVANEGASPPISVKLKRLADNLKALSSTPLPVSRLQNANTQVCNSVDTMEPKTPVVTHKMDTSKCQSGSFSKRSSGLKQALVQNYLHFLNTASEDDLKGISGIKEKRASYILELREKSPEPFKSLDDLQELGLSAKQVKNMMKDVVRDLFS
ncbi:unnamed protein product [Lactuca virosa]|uniref:Kinesin motor domain-containing protein n=1 Tax=Lactuca virosa TaxID=75947 RepID=A0AAU9NM68_9ASTR|nr:unnamed protein product [Lactuca virosa]